MKQWKLVFIGLSVLCLAACGRIEEHDAYHLDYRIAGTSAAGLTKQIKLPNIAICLSDSTQSAQHQDDVTHAILTWIDALRELTADALASEVTFVGINDPCQASVYIGSYSPAYTNMGAKPSVHLNYDGWFGSRTVTLHEFGHAFGLLDTYNGTGGSCQSGQPNSVMCRASYNELQPDDKLGVRAIYANVWPTPPDA